MIKNTNQICNLSVDLCKKKIEFKKKVTQNKLISFEKNNNVIENNFFGRIKFLNLY